MTTTPSPGPAEHVGLEELPCACFIVTRDGVVRAANGRAGTLLSTSATAIVGRHVLSLYADRPEGRPRAGELRERFLHGRSIDGEVVAFRSADGRTVWGQLWVQPVTDGTGRTTESRSLVVDVSAQHDAEAASHRSEQRFRAAFDDAPTPAALLDHDGIILRANAALVELLGGAIPTPVHLSSLFDDGPGHAPDADHRLVTRRGHTRWVRVTAAVIGSEQDDEAHELVHLEDVTEARRLRHELQEAAVRDPLTGLLNRRGLAERGREILAAADRHGHPSGLLFLDVIGLKQVNDTEGHAAGDRLIVDVADALRRRFRAQDQLARWGGDEFCVLLEDTGAHELEQLVAAWEETAGGPDTSRRLRAGFAVRAAGSASGLDELIDAADDAMYDARRDDPSGRAVSPP